MSWPSYHPAISAVTPSSFALLPLGFPFFHHISSQLALPTSGILHSRSSCFSYPAIHYPGYHLPLSAHTCANESKEPVLFFNLLCPQVLRRRLAILAAGRCRLPCPFTSLDSPHRDPFLVEFLDFRGTFSFDSFHALPSSSTHTFPRLIIIVVFNFYFLVQIFSLSLALVGFFCAPTPSLHSS